MLKINGHPSYVKDQNPIFVFGLWGLPRHFGRLGVRYSNSQRNSENFDMLDVLSHPAQISRDNPHGFSKSD